MTSTQTPRKSRSLRFIISTLLALMILSGCTFKEEPNTQRETVEDITMESGIGSFLSLNGLTVTTDKRTFTLATLDTDFYKSTSDKDYVTYNLYSDGTMGYASIHLSDSGVKHYSKQYTDTFGGTLLIKPEK